MHLLPSPTPLYLRLLHTEGEREHPVLFTTTALHIRLALVVAIAVAVAVNCAADVAAVVALDDGDCIEIVKRI